MQVPTVVIPLVLEWAILITTVAPLVFTNRFDGMPRLGLVIWFTSLLSAGLSIAVAIIVSIASYLETVSKLNSSKVGSASWFEIIGISFGPWVALAVGGISLALINQRLEPLIKTSKQIAPALGIGKEPLRTFNGVPVHQLELNIPFALATKSEVLLSSFLVSKASDSELEAVLWHETFHVKQFHYSIKALSRFIFHLWPRLAASGALVSEVERLMEIAADQFASKKCTPDAVLSAKKLFS